MAGILTPQPFPFCIPSSSDAEQTVGDGTFFPIGLTWDQLFELYYRVRTATFSFTQGWSGDRYGTPPSPRTFSGSGSASDTITLQTFLSSFDESPPSSEVDYICEARHTEASITGSGTENNPYTGTTNPVALGAAITIFTPFGAASGGVISDGGLYYPSITLNGGASATTLTFWNSTYSPSAVTQTFSVDFFGYGTVSVGYDGFVGGSPPLPDDTISLTASLTAESYWPFDPNDGGGPIVDSSSGAELRDPYSVQQWFP